MEDCMMRRINKIVIHCTATPQSISKEQIVGAFVGRGWKNPGYHYLISADGSIHSLLECDKIANGVKGHNADSIHVAYVGGIDGLCKPLDNRTKQQKTAIKALLLHLKHDFPNAEILGHRDLSPDLNGNGIVDSWERMKECPCFDVIKEYDGL